MALLGIDLRNSAVKVIVLDTEGCSLSISKVGYEVMSPHPRWAEGDPNAWWRACASSDGAGSPCQDHRDWPLRTDAWRGSDRQGRTARAALLWADTRAEEELKRYQALPPALLRQLANPLVPGMAGPLVCWLADHEPVAHQATRWARAEEM